MADVERDGLHEVALWVRRRPNEIHQFEYLLLLMTQSASRHGSLLATQHSIKSDWIGRANCIWKTSKRTLERLSFISQLWHFYRSRKKLKQTLLNHFYSKYKRNTIKSSALVSFCFQSGVFRIGEIRSGIQVSISKERKRYVSFIQA